MGVVFIKMCVKYPLELPWLMYVPGMYVLYVYVRMLHYR
jgi:hypothetical protein